MQAEALLQQFAVFGRYYQRCIAGVEESLRDRLEIVPRPWSLTDLLGSTPDLLVIMMNPGASRPLTALWDGLEGGHAAADAAAPAGNGFVAALPDRTQYQIMRLLLAAQQRGRAWRHARILNLSDLRTPKSTVFIEKLNTYKDDDSHSLFSDARRADCRHALGDGAAPVLCAWGLSPHFVPLAQRALAAVTGRRLLGLSADGVLYRHPLPQRHDLQLQWLAQMVAQVDAY